MSDQFNRAKRRKILNKVSDTIDKWDNANAKITEAIQRAEKAEAEINRLRELITECDGIECTKHDVLVRTAVKEQARLRAALKQAEEKAQVAVSILADAHDEDAGCAFTLDIDAEDRDVGCFACLAQIQLAEITVESLMSNQPRKEKPINDQ